MSKRDSFCTLILGTNGTGKSSFAELNILQKAKTRALIVSANTASWRNYPMIDSKQLKTFKGVKLMKFRKDETFANVLHKYRKGILIFDDYKDYDLNSDEIELLRSFLINRRLYSLDIYIIAHGFSDIVPRFIYNYVTHFVAFKNTTNPAVIGSQVDKNLVDRIRKVQNKVNSDWKPQTQNQRISNYLIMKV